MHKIQQHLLASLLILTGALAAPVMAKGNPELSDRTFKTVNKVQELIATEKYSQAIDKLESALDRTKSRKYDRAVLLQQMGFLYSMQDNYGKASQFFAKSLAEDALPVPVAQQVRYSLAPALFGRRAISAFDQHNEAMVRHRQDYRGEAKCPRLHHARQCVCSDGGLQKRNSTGQTSDSDESKP